VTSNYTQMWSQEAVDTLRELPGHVVMVVLSNLMLLPQTPRPTVAGDLNVEIGNGLYRLMMPGNIAVVDYEVVDRTIKILMITPTELQRAVPPVADLCGC
jgi:hypothetical protein